jgi:hypothetical protein
MRTTALICGFALLTATLTACGGGMTTPASTPSMQSMPGMSSMDDMPIGDGLTSSSLGFTFVPATSTLSTGQNTFTFHITGPNGKTVTYFQPEQTKLLHFYLIRSDLTGFQHLHPTMGNDGTWRVPVSIADPGSYRAYVTFTTTDSQGKPASSVLSTALSVPGKTAGLPLPPATPSTQVDGYAVALSQQPHQLMLQITKNGAPATDLQPYLGVMAHLTAFHSGDLAFAHLHPTGSGADLMFDTDFPHTGGWRLFVQFQTNNIVHTAALTLNVT